MSRTIAFAFPGDLALKTGGYAYDRRVIDGLRNRGWDVQCLPLGDGFPNPSLETKALAEDLLSRLPDGAQVVVDGLAFGVLDTWAERESKRLRIVPLVHHPLALETGLDAEQQQDLAASERKAIACAEHVIVTSSMTARELTSRYGVPSDKVTVAIPGTEPGAPARGEGDPAHIVSIGTLIPRKGHDVLIAALKRIEHLSWTATIVGSHNLSPRTAREIEEQLGESGLAERVNLAGEVADVRPVLASADIFTLASRFEGYGMVFAEALSHGLPIVACRTGAVPDVVPEEAGILTGIDDIDAFAAALGSLVADMELRQRKAEAAGRAGALLPNWDRTVDIIADRLETLP
ncbi:glycosyltransferase family 4 protein [Pseudorhizobium flavum]|uniref:Glycosyltransferase involved in cell wall biosynthesis n=1 Tax=Pseudorhizobium flavum TaxID=1335061 RepID=A0A7W9YVP5_9HYPH|nr:glycosyltransferase family 4 protein [Pseudorhizobium flavum]MBB6179243.1 glycosyltransferase involved in cell wall biosynthesis [Pseudorhizobium flavum]CAD6603942.1 glycosyltransferase family 1 protein [Pseudorhizobium flavum]